MDSHTSENLFTDITSTLNDDTLALEASSDIPEVDLGMLRSPSRLGFCFTQSNGGYEGDPEFAENRPNFKWAFAPFCKAGQQDHEPEAPTLLADISFSSNSSSEPEDASSDDSVSDEQDVALFTLFPSTPGTAPPASDPPAQSSPARPVALSPLSPNYCHIRNPFPEPIQNNHHGLSQSSLTHQKWLWQHRYEEWVAWEARMKEAESANVESPYGGIAILPGTCGEKSLYPSRSPPLSRSPPPSPAPTQNSKIFPRMGDLSALRDPYSAAIDRCFCSFPLWTMQKTLFMFDMHHRASVISESNGNGRESYAAPAAVERASYELGPTVDITVTEVESENDSPESQFEEELGDMTLLSIDDGDGDSDVTAVSPSNSCLSSARTKCSSLPEDDDLARHDGASNFHMGDGARTWETNWYARWELLTELVRRDARERHAPAPAPPPKARPGATFFLAEEDEDEDEWDGDSDDEDYGAIVANPVYGGRGAQMGFECAQAFFAGELCRGIDVRSGAKTMVVAL